MEIDPRINCECKECQEYSGPDPTIMRFRLFLFAAQYVYAAVALMLAKSWKSLTVTFGALAFFFPLRYIVCARCQNYGKNCYSLYLGRITSMMMPKVEGKEIGPVSFILEVVTLYLITMGPVFGLMRKFKLLVPYMGLLSGTLGLQFMHSCRHCGLYAKEGTWQSKCPAGKIANIIYTL
ncbi:MAG: hypothetical protein JW738_04550 [Actinobacteria bacterium]|nr:hypothetical protein [Actinomycetota bacterium]